MTAELQTAYMIEGRLRSICRTAGLDHLSGQAWSQSVRCVTDAHHEVSLQSSLKSLSILIRWNLVLAIVITKQSSHYATTYDSDIPATVQSHFTTAFDGLEEVVTPDGVHNANHYLIFPLVEA